MEIIHWQWPLLMYPFAEVVCKQGTAHNKSLLYFLSECAWLCDTLDSAIDQLDLME